MDSLVRLWSHLRERTAHGEDQLVEGYRQRCRAGDETEANPFSRHDITVPPVGLTKTAPCPVPHHAATKSAAGSEANSSRSGLSPPEQHERGALYTCPAPEESIELRAGSKPLRARELGPRGQRPGHPT